MSLGNKPGRQVWATGLGDREPTLAPRPRRQERIPTPKRARRGKKERGSGLANLGVSHFEVGFVSRFESLSQRACPAKGDFSHYP